jgi:KaiC/GvpD/RAD55 family RecA-like ATPase
MDGQDTIEDISKEIKSLMESAKKFTEAIQRLDERLKSLQGLPQQKAAPVAVSQPKPPAAVPAAPPSPGADLSFRDTRLSTGNEKVDQLLVGGVRVGTSVILIGPPFSGKYVLAWNFVAQALNDQVPVLVITTDRDINEIKYQVGRIYPDIEEAENNCMLRFIDLYSRSIQTQSPSKHAIVIDSILNISSLLKAADSVAAEFKTKSPYYKVLFSSLTSYATEFDEKLLVKFIQQFSQKRKIEGAVSFYLMEGGVFERKLTESVSYIVDGVIEFKADTNKSYLRVTGLGNVRSRDWIELYMNDTSFDLGSFTLEKIR